jgi:vacuolar-type H+-ATPase subunit F/Vma7
MSGVVAIGDETLLAGYAAVGVTVVGAHDRREVLTAWEETPDAGLVLLTPEAHAALATRLDERRVLWAVLPG